MKPIHPGVHIKNRIIPSTMPVNEAAKRLGVSRPTLSKLLNGKAALSSKMASRLEKAFRANPKDLMQMQAEFDQQEQLSLGRKLPVGAYVPPFLKTTAKDIEEWDSLTHINLVVAVEHRFKIKFTVKQVSTLPDVGSFIELIDRRVNGQ